MIYKKYEDAFLECMRDNVNFEELQKAYFMDVKETLIKVVKEKESKLAKIARAHPLG